MWPDAPSATPCRGPSREGGREGVAPSRRNQLQERAGRTWEGVGKGSGRPPVLPFPPSYGGRAEGADTSRKTVAGEPRVLTLSRRSSRQGERAEAHPPMAGPAARRTPRFHDA